MPPSRLLPNSRRPGPSARPSASASAHATHPTLPRYEPPSHPLNELGKRALFELTSTRETRHYDAHLTKSATCLRDTVGAINDVLFLRRKQLFNVIDRRRQRGEEEKSELELQLEEEVAQMERKVKTLTERAEAAMRDVIDSRAELEDEAKVLGMVVQGAVAQKPRREKVKKELRPRRREREGSDEDDLENKEQEEPEDEEMPDAEEGYDPPITGLKELLQAGRRTTAAEYARLTAHQRYGQNNDYISFKKTWHDSLHQEDQVPLPHASTWFDEHGRPVQDVGPRADEDEDLVVEREIIDLKCPLSLQIMNEPYSNRKCKHTFEKSAIMDFLQSSRGVAKCPVCSQELRVADFFLDELMLRKLKRAKEAAHREQEEEDAYDDADESIIPGRSVDVKKERVRGRRVVEDMEEDSE